MSKLTPIQQILSDYGDGKYVRVLKEHKGSTDATTGLKEAAQAITDLINEAIDEAESFWHYEDGIEVAESMARDIRTKLGLTTKENK